MRCTATSLQLDIPDSPLCQLPSVRAPRALWQRTDSRNTDAVAGNVISGSCEKYTVTAAAEATEHGEAFVWFLFFFFTCMFIMCTCVYWESLFVLETSSLCCRAAGSFSSIKASMQNYLSGIKPLCCLEVADPQPCLWLEKHTAPDHNEGNNVVFPLDCRKLHVRIHENKMFVWSEGRGKIIFIGGFYKKKSEWKVERQWNYYKYNACHFPQALTCLKNISN